MESSALVYVALTILTVGLAMLVENKSYIIDCVRGGRSFGKPITNNRQYARNQIVIFAVWALLTAVSACRIAVGNDYWVYRRNFDLIAQERHVSSEFGFNSIVRLFQWIFDPGKVQYVSIFAFFSIVTVFFFVKALKDQGSEFAFSLFLLMTGGYYFNSLNSVRYYFALALALYCMKYVLRGEYAKFILLTLAGALIHKSIILIIPAYLIAKFIATRKWKIWYPLVAAPLVLSFVVFPQVYRKIIFFFYPFYQNSEFDQGQISWVNILKCVCVLVLCVICYRESLVTDVRRRFYTVLNVFGLVIYCCGSFIPETSRIGYYMIISQIFLIPELVSNIKIKWLKYMSYIGVIIAFVGYFILLLKGMYATDIRLLPYLNWIFN